MYQLAALVCRHCHQPILLPPSTRSGTFPNQTPWLWGNEPQNVACLSCKQVFECSAEDFFWHPARSKDQLDETKETAAHLLVVPCGVKQCAGLIRILVIARRGLPPSEGNEIAHSLNATGAVCGNGHRTTFRVADKSFQIVREIEDF